MAATRVSTYADAYVTTHGQFTDLIGSLSDEQWRLVGKNFPQQLNNEDESRPIGVIAHHVADAEQFIIDRIYAMLEGKSLPPIDIHEINARQAVVHAAVTRDEVLAHLRVNERQIAARVRAIPEDALDKVHETPAGPATIAQRLERVLIGHIKMHQGSIEDALAG
ncbi:MAG TPA: DinB family protein [Candidatus Dormibacteraeota bacterium]|nr:DinB family protein [Candidatus Dormibacteraeota bacterium]